MSLTLYIAAMANLTISLCYYAIAALIGAGLITQRRLGFNPLATATFFIFFSCASGHALHAAHYLLDPAMYEMDRSLWQLMLVDGLTVIPAASYLTQRRRYGLVIRGPHALLDFQRRLEVAEALRETGQDIAACTDLSALLERVAVHARGLLGADYAVALALDELDTPHVRSAGTLSQDHAAREAAAALLEAVRPLRVPLPVASLDALGDPRLARLHAAEAACALLLVALPRGAALRGALVLGYRAPRAAAREELSALSVLAGQAAVAVENARLIAELRRAERLKDEFLSVAAHELKTPITSLRGFAQLLLRQATRDGHLDGQKAQRGLRAIDQQSEKLTRLVAQLLDVSRLDAGQLAVQPEPTDLAALTREVVAVIAPQTHRHGITVRVGSIGLALADPLRLEQVLTNLIDNAVKYSPEGGPVELALSQPEPRAIRLEVRDHGVGVAPESRAHIFDRLYQAREVDRTAGLGLGLYISRQIISLHGGTITAEFPEDGGTRMVLTLPAAAGGAREGVDGRQPGVHPGGG